MGFLLLQFWSCLDIKLLYYSNVLFSAIIMFYISMKILLILCCFEELMLYDLDEMNSIVKVYLLFVLFTSIALQTMLVGLLCSGDCSAQIFIKSAHFSL